eukprot:gene16892-biopygen8044
MFRTATCADMAQKSFGGLLAGFWRAFGGLLAGFWRASGGALAAPGEVTYPDLWRLRVELRFAVNDLCLISRKIISFQDPAHSLFSSYQDFRDTKAQLTRMADSTDNLSQKTRDELLKAQSVKEKNKMGNVLKDCAKAGVEKCKFYPSSSMSKEVVVSKEMPGIVFPWTDREGRYSDQYWSTKQSFAMLFCISCLDPRNHVDIPASHTFLEMGKYLRGMWTTNVNEAEWDRYRKKATKLATLFELPKKASGVLAWWAEACVRDAFPTIAKFVCDVIAMLPCSSALVERSFSRLGHIQTKERLNMRDDTFEALTFLYVNGEFCLGGGDFLSMDDSILLARYSLRSMRELRWRALALGATCSVTLQKSFGGDLAGIWRAFGGHLAGIWRAFGGDLAGIWWAAPFWPVNRLAGIWRGFGGDSAMQVVERSSVFRAAPFRFAVGHARPLFGQPRGQLRSTAARG